MQKRHRDAQVEWTELKWIEEYIKEKIEEYLQIFNQSISSDQYGNDQDKNVFIDEQSNSFDSFPNEDDEEDQSENVERKKIYYGKKPKKVVVEEEISVDDATKTASINGVRLDPLDESKRKPKQEEAYRELNSINQRISSLVQMKQMGLSTPENTKQLKQLMAERKKAAFKLRRLQLRQKASNKYRVKQRKIVNTSSLSRLL